MHLLEDPSCELRLENVCLLDPKAEQELSPNDGDGRFVGFLFGVSGPLANSSLALPMSYVAPRSVCVAQPLFVSA